MPTTIKRKATLASAIGALAVAAAGCGGGGGQSAATTMGGTTTSQGGVAGAQANVGSQQLRTQANRIQQMLNRQLNRLGQVNSTKDLSQTAKSTRQQVLQAANRLDKLNLSSAKAQQLRGQLESSLRSLAADITTIQTDAQSGNLTQALADLTQLSSITAVRNAVANVRNGVNSSSQQSLQSMGMNLAQQLRSRMAGLQAVNSAQAFSKRVDQLQATLRQTDQAIANLNVPQSQQDSKQQLRTFIDQWQTDLKSAKQHAEQGQLQQAKQMALGLSLQDLQSLLNGLQKTTTSS
jgi:soluble cytochrome b562